MAGQTRRARRVAGIILAGGRGERLGGADKAQLVIGGMPLIERVRHALAGCDPLLIASGPGPADKGAIADLDTAYGGPLAGLAAAAEALRNAPPHHLLTVAVDTPFFPSDFVERALAFDAPAVLAAWHGQDYPTNALWAYAAVADLPARTRDGTAPHSLKRLAAALGASRLDYSALASEDPFFNVNTAADLAVAEARAVR